MCVSTEHSWSDIDRERPKYSEKTLPHYHLNNKFHLNYIYRFSSHRAVHTLRLSYKKQSVNAVQ